MACCGLFSTPFCLDVKAPSHVTRRETADGPKCLQAKGLCTITRTLSPDFAFTVEGGPKWKPRPIVCTGPPQSTRSLEHTPTATAPADTRVLPPGGRSTGGGGVECLGDRVRGPPFALGRRAPGAATSVPMAWSAGSDGPGGAGRARRRSLAGADGRRGTAGGAVKAEPQNRRGAGPRGKTCGRRGTRGGVEERRGSKRWPGHRRGCRSGAATPGARWKRKSSLGCRPPSVSRGSSQPKERCEALTCAGETLRGEGVDEISGSAFALFVVP